MRWFVLCLIWGCSLFFAAYSGGAAGWFLVISLGLLNGFACWAKAAGIRVESWERKVSRNELEAGYSVTVKTTLQLRSRFPFTWVQVEEKWQCPLDDGEWSIKKLGFVGGRTELTYEYSLPDLPRGLYCSEAIQLYYGDGLGITQSKKKLENSCVITVYPKPMDRLSPFCKLESDRGAPSAVRAYTSFHSEPDGLRDYRIGDSMKHIHWKQSAKYGMLKTREHTKWFEEHSCLWIHGELLRGEQQNRNPIWETIVYMAAGLSHKDEPDMHKLSTVVSIQDESGDIRFTLAESRSRLRRLLAAFPFVDLDEWPDPPEIIRNQSWTVLTSKLWGDWIQPLMRTRKSLKLIYVAEELLPEDRERLDEMMSWGIEAVWVKPSSTLRYVEKEGFDVGA
ncbi:DUF58 domain-containing protein [Marinicrinis lubricantis]|uniref:DUF58 domain-containing protein n=1 Tax=Marinicrinis lubricantis TaxID=2086470 RepID=A0ABW1IIZ8_9BACL